MLLASRQGPGKHQGRSGCGQHYPVTGCVYWGVREWCGGVPASPVPGGTGGLAWESTLVEGSGVCVLMVLGELVSGVGLPTASPILPPPLLHPWAAPSRRRHSGNKRKSSLYCAPPGAPVASPRDLASPAPSPGERNACPRSTWMSTGPPRRVGTSHVQTSVVHIGPEWSLNSAGMAP